MKLGLHATLLAIVCVVSVGVAGTAPATTFAKPGAKTARNPYCPPRSICLHSNSNFRGIRHVYTCRGWAPGSYLGFDLRDDFAVGYYNGVSSWQNNGVRKASLLGGGNLPLWGRHGNVPRAQNDWASELSVLC